jgi:hypothetical protein
VPGYYGSRGYTGSKGDTGNASTIPGPQGLMGYYGSRGYTGSSGDAGSTGYWGSTGYTGSMGYTGSTGPIGGTNGQVLYNNSGTVAGFGNTNGSNLSIYGNIYASGDIYSSYSSDKNLKENIQDIENALDKVMAIGGKTFDWTDSYLNENGSPENEYLRKSDFGVIAQDVQLVFPVAVRIRSNGRLAVDYEKLCALAFAAIKELKTQFDQLKNQ